MVYDLIVKPDAENDLKEALNWYQRQNTNLSEKLLFNIDKGLEKIQRNPEHFQRKYKEIRIIFIKVFPYGIFYTIEENTIFVHAILHTKQNPAILDKRV